MDCLAKSNNGMIKTPIKALQVGSLTVRWMAAQIAWLQTFLHTYNCQNWTCSCAVSFAASPPSSNDDYRSRSQNKCVDSNPERDGIGIQQFTTALPLPIVGPHFRYKYHHWLDLITQILS